MIAPDPGIDPAGCDHRGLLRDSIRQFVAREGGRGRIRAVRETLAGFDRRYWTRLAELGCVGALAPASHGGLGLDLADLASVAHELGAAVVPEPFVPVAVGAVRLLSLVPESPLAQQLLPRIVDGRVVPQLAWQEPGDDLPSVAGTELRSRDGQGVLIGRKCHVLPGRGDGLLVTASSPDGLALCWIPDGSSGVATTVSRRVDGATCAEVSFDLVAIPAAQQARGPGLDEAAVARVANESNLCASAELLGVAECALRLTLEHLRTRRQFGRPIGSFQALQHRVVDLYVRQELARAALQAALDAHRDGATGAALDLACSRAKARCADTALSVCKEAVQMHGAMGFADECDVGLLLKRALSSTAWLGNREFHRGRVGRLHPTLAEAAPAEEPPIPTRSPVDWSSLSDREFRLRVRDVFEREYPAELRNPPRRLRWHECRSFYRRLGELGLLALAWPKEHGGSGLSARQQLIFMQEQDRWGIARAPDMGITMVGPGLIRFGTPEQRRRYLPAILRFEHMWCQGFSEPEAGSDLASLRTRAVRDGSEYVVDGAKLWTTFAHDATHMFVLVRTSQTAKKQAGISMLLVDLSTPGITTRPLRDIAGNDEFCEVVFDGARVPVDCLLGRENDGWTVAKSLLASERIYLGNPRQSQNALKRVDALASRLRLTDDPVFLSRLTALRMDVWDLAALYERFADQVRRGEALGPDVSILKLFGSETFQRLSELAVEGVGAAGGLWGEVPLGGEPDNVMSLFMNARPATIYGGSNEVQRNVLAKQVLMLPET